MCFPAASSRRCRRCRGHWQRPTDLKIFHLEDIGPHYARTLRALARAILPPSRHGSASSATRDSFVRLWEYYLCYCEGGFTERQLGTVQMTAERELRGFGDASASQLLQVLHLVTPRILRPRLPVRKLIPSVDATGGTTPGAGFQRARACRTRHSARPTLLPAMHPHCVVVEVRHAV